MPNLLQAKKTSGISGVLESAMYFKETYSLDVRFATRERDSGKSQVLRLDKIQSLQ